MLIEPISKMAFVNRDLVSEMTNKLNVTEEALEKVSQENNATDTKLDALKEDAQKLERTAKELLEQVEFVKNSDVRGKYTSQQPSDTLCASNLLTC